MNEFQAAYQLSQAEQTNCNVVVPEGMFAVVQESLAYCPITDATLPNPARHIISVHGSRKVAEHLAKKLQATNEWDGEIDYVVLPRLPRPVAVAASRSFDECPF